MSGQALNVLMVFMISETIVNLPDVHIWSVVIVATAVQKLQRTLIAPSS
jgi:hypothetical protein